LRKSRSASVGARAAARIPPLRRAASNARLNFASRNPKLDPFAVPPYLTAPFPAYVSVWSALARHGMIEQIPRTISVCSTVEPRRTETSFGVYEIHQIVPELFDGYTGDDLTVCSAGWRSLST
jgi:hypothetical protein